MVCGTRSSQGSALRVERSGTKTFIIRYCTEGGGHSAPLRLMTVARFGVLTVDRARKNAKAVLAAANGGDLAGDVLEKRREKTMKELLDFHEEHDCFIPVRPP